MDATCELRAWKVFAPGTHKETGEYFSPESCRKIGANYDRFSSGDEPALVPGLKLGHHRRQRYAKSFGFPSLGKITAAHAEPDGVLVVDRAVEIPRIVGSAIVSGMIRGSSVEFPPPGVFRDPSDPGAKIDGDVLMGVALLGEELPAVPGFAIPTPVFADGSEVPPLTDEEQRWWLENMAAVAGGDEDSDDALDSYSAHAVCFSALTYSLETPAVDETTPPVAPVLDAATIVAALQADPALKEQVMAMMQGDANPAVPVTPVDASPATFAAEAKGGDDAPPWFKAFNCDMTKRMGALEAAKDAEQKKSEAAQMSALSAMVDADLQATDAARKIKPVALPLVRQVGLGILTAKTFAAEADRQTAYGEWKHQLAALPIDPALRDSAQDQPKTGDVKALAANNPQLVGMLKSPFLLRERPETMKRLNEKFLGVAN